MKPSKIGKLAEEADLKQDTSDDATRKRIKKHLSDINDVITEDDIRNVKVPGKKTKKEKVKPETDKTVDQNDKSTLTTWNLLEE